MMDSEVAAEVLQFWLGELDGYGMSGDSHRQLWFRSSPELDDNIRARFGAEIDAAINGELDHWAETDTGLIALILLLDQFTRNVYRGSTRAFAGDERALRLARDATASGRDQRLPIIHRVFLYMPFEHAEELVAQQQGMACFEKLLADCPEEIRHISADFQRYMVAHADVIRRYGRFPHRNAILGRASSTAEQEYLATHGGF